MVKSKTDKKVSTSKPTSANNLPIVRAEKSEPGRRRTLTPSKIAELRNSGDFEDIPVELLEVITSQLKGRDLGALACTCKYFKRNSLIDRVATAQVEFVPRAKGVVPDEARGETWPMLSYYFQCQSAAAAQSTALSMGHHHGCALLVEEDLTDPEDPRGGEIGLYGWGKNFYGQVGDRGFESCSTPKKISLGSSLFSPSEALPAVVCCGDSHSVALSRKGDMFVWGLSSCNQIGLGGNIMELPVPRALPAFERRRIVSVSAGTNHTLAIDELGQLWTCGQGHRGQLGTGDNPSESPFALVTNLQGFKVVATAAGVAHSVALTADGSVFTWGDCTYGQLGHAAFQSLPGECLNKPWKVQALNPNKLDPKQRITSIAAGGYHTLMLTVTGEVFVCGRNSHGQLGLGHFEDVWTPVPMPLDYDPAPQIQPPRAPLWRQTALLQRQPLSDAMEVDAFDPQPSGRLFAPLAPSAHKTSSSLYTPFTTTTTTQTNANNDTNNNTIHADPVGGGAVVRAVQVAGGLLHTVALVMRAGRLEVHACGFNSCGQLGTGGLEPSVSLRPVRNLAGKRITAVVCGDESSSAIGGNGEIFVWGRNGEGQLGLGDDRSRLEPEKVPGFRAVHPDRTLRRRGTKSYVAVKRRAEEEDGMAEAPSTTQPDALWIVRALWQKSRLGRVPEDVEGALTTTANQMGFEDPSPLRMADGGELMSDLAVAAEDNADAMSCGAECTVNQRSISEMEPTPLTVEQRKGGPNSAGKRTGRRYSWVQDLAGANSPMDVSQGL